MASTRAPSVWPLGMISMVGLLRAGLVSPRTGQRTTAATTSRVFPRQKMPGARDQSPLQQAVNSRSRGIDPAGAPDAIIFTMQNDRRHANRRLTRQPRFQTVICRIARRIAVTMPIRLDRHIDEIRIVETGCGGRNVASSNAQFGDHSRHSSRVSSVAIRRQPGPPALGMEIPLIPVTIFLLRRRRMRGGGDILDAIAGDGDQPGNPLRPQRRDNAGRPPAPVIANQDRATGSPAHP